MTSRSVVRKNADSIPKDTLDVVELASVEVSSEQELHAIDHVFDGRGGPGGSCWISAKTGAQTVVLRFRAPTDIGTLTIESEERVTCSQEIVVAGVREDDRGQFEAAPRVFHYSPYGRSFHRETWELAERGVTQVFVRIVPAPRVRQATLTAIIFR